MIPPDTVQHSAAPWMASAPDLARWTMANLVNRDDVHGLYCPWTDSRGQSHTTMTAPAKPRRGRERLDEATLERHFRGERHAIVGLHTTSAAAARGALNTGRTSRWLAFDIDAHEGQDADPAANWAATSRLAARLRELGAVPLIEDSNGAGGFHVWIVFRDPAPTVRVYGAGARILSELGLDVEIFPKQAAPGTYGNWLRLPGRHHTRPHWSRSITGANGLKAREPSRTCSASRASTRADYRLHCRQRCRSSRDRRSASAVAARATPSGAPPRTSLEFRIGQPARIGTGGGTRSLAFLFASSR